MGCSKKQKKNKQTHYNRINARLLTFEIDYYKQ